MADIIDDLVALIVTEGNGQGISSGKSMPSMAQFLNICDYFEITPMQFFDGESLNPQLVRKAMDGMRELDDGDMLLLLNLIQRLRGR